MGNERRKMEAWCIFWDLFLLGPKLLILLLHFYRVFVCFVDGMLVFAL